MYVCVSLRERESRRQRDLCIEEKMDLCNLSLCVKYNLHIGCIICFLLGQEHTEIRRDIVKEEFYLCLLCVLLHHLD